MEENYLVYVYKIRVGEPNKHEYYGYFQSTGLAHNYIKNKYKGYLKCIQNKWSYADEIVYERNFKNSYIEIYILDCNHRDYLDCPVSTDRVIKIENKSEANTYE